MFLSNYFSFFCRRRLICMLRIRSVTLTALLLLGLQQSSLSRNITSCSFAPWFEDRGLVSSLVMERSDSRGNHVASPDCLEACTSQMLNVSVAHNRTGSAAGHREAFMQCCVWFRLQIHGLVLPAP